VIREPLFVIQVSSFSELSVPIRAIRGFSYFISCLFVFIRG